MGGEEEEEKEKVEPESTHTAMNHGRRIHTDRPANAKMKMNESSIFFSLKIKL